MKRTEYDRQYDGEISIDTYIKLRRDDFLQQWEQYIKEEPDYRLIYKEIHKLSKEGFPF